MIKFIIKKLLIATMLLFCVSTIVFSVMALMPGDPAVLMLGTDTAPDPQAVAALREELGLNKPIPVRYIEWIANALKGDLGMSYSERIPVVESISIRLPKTLELAFASLILACLIGIPLGIISALNRNNPIDFIFTSAASLGTSIPVYVLGYFLVLVFAINIFGWSINTLPSSGYYNFSRDAVKHFQRLILPAITLALGLSAGIMRMTRSSVLEALASDSVRALKAKGLKNIKVVGKHVMRNALIPIITIIGLQLGALIGGTVLCESVFNWPGLSTLLIRAINFRDYPLIQGCVLIMSAIFIVTNLVVETLYGLLDPRVR